MLGVYSYTVIITYLSMVSAMVGMYFSVEGNFKAALFCLLFSGLCDMLDGPVARTKKNRTETEKKFGIQIDSLCDCISFGVQPSVYVYCLVKANTESDSVLRILAVICAVVFSLCAVIRLAFFNVLEEERQATEGNKKRTSYRGLPVTCGVFTVALSYLSVYSRSQLILSVVTLALAYLTAFLFVLDFKMFKAHGKFLIVLFFIGAAIFTGIVLS